MTAIDRQALRRLLLRQEIAALATLHRDEPFASMVPYALLNAGGGLVIHVSRLAAHTRDMLAHPTVSLLVVADRTPEVAVQALERASLQCDARPCTSESPDHAEAKRSYLRRFASSEPIFDFADFSLFVLVPRSVRYVGGFANAWSITGEAYAKLMSV